MSLPTKKCKREKSEQVIIDRSNFSESRVSNLNSVTRFIAQNCAELCGIARNCVQVKYTSRLETLPYSASLSTPK